MISLVRSSPFLVTLACSCRYSIRCVDLARDLLSYAYSHATCLYNLEGHLAAQFGTPTGKKKKRMGPTNLDFITPGDSSTPSARIHRHDLASRTESSVYPIGVSLSPIVSKDEPYEILQTRVSERSRRDAMLSFAHPEQLSSHSRISKTDPITPAAVFCLQIIGR